MIGGFPKWSSRLLNLKKRQLRFTQWHFACELYRVSRRQISRLIGPSIEGQSFLFRTEKNAKRTNTKLPLRPPLPKARAFAFRTTGFRCVVNPQEFEVCVGEEKPAISGSLSGVPIARTFHQPQLSQRFGFRSTFRAADENMV